MAFSEFYMQTTGSNTNAGSTSGDAAIASATNGDWGNAAANRYTAASGTPFSGVSVGDWASVYPDGGSAAVYVAQVTAVNGGGTSIDLSSTNKIGTAPTTAATGVSCKVGGAWADLGVVTSLFAAGSTPFSMRVNVKQGTYSTGATDRTFTTAGASPQTPIWWRGYNTTPGDCDADPTLAKPTWSATTARLVVTGTNQIFSSLIMTSARAGYTLTTNGTAGNAVGSVRFFRCRIANTNGTSAAQAYQAQGNVPHFTLCRFSAPATAGTVVGANIAGVYLGCTFTGGGDGFGTVQSTQTILQCVFRSIGGHAINSSSNSVHQIVGCTFHAVGGDAIRYTTIPAASVISQCLFSTINGTAINNATGGNGVAITRSFNDFYACGAITANLGDSPTLAVYSESTSPFVNAAGGDLSLVSSSTAKGTGLGQFEGESFASYHDIGAVQRQETGGAGTYTDPGTANVRSGTSYIYNDAVKAGTLVVPAAADVRSGAAVDATTGTLVVPSLADTKVGVAGDGGIGAYDGSDRWTDPGVANVRGGTAYKANSIVNNRTGTVVLPDVGDVRQSSTYGAAGTEYTGTLVVSGGSTDWTASERAQIRYRLGIDGAATAPGSGVPQLGTVAANVTMWSGAAVPAPAAAGMPKVDVAYVAGQAARTFDGTAQASTAMTIDLDPTEPAVGNTLVGRRLTIVSGTGAGQSRYITAYAGPPARRATVHRAWEVMPDATSQYVLESTAESDVMAVGHQPLSAQVGPNFNSFFQNSGGTTARIVDDVGSAAATDWTTAERSQIRYRLGLDGTAQSPTAATGLGTVDARVVAFAAATIGGSALAPSAVAAIQSGLATGAAQASIGSNVASILSQTGSTGVRVADKAGYSLAASGLDAIAVADPGTPANHSTLPRMIVALWRRTFKKTTLDSGHLRTYADDGVTVNSTQALADDGTTQTMGAAT